MVEVLSHETRNILSSFATCLALLRRSTLNDQDKELVDILQAGARRLNEISEQFAAFGPRPPLQLEPLDISAVIKDAIERLRRDERCSAALDFHIECDQAVGPVAADRHFLGKVFWNLFLNAAQAMDERGILTVETRQLDGAIEISIGDSGPGIASSIRERVFDPLFTTKTRAAGLGLAIARRIVEEHNGELRLDQKNRTGSHFTLILPAQGGRKPPAKQRALAKAGGNTR
ncbi:MAG TPA: ATP-binding protein [Candidatus Binatia bacterium]|nr:ATP-binding protein [Candidatus Binatia bacterium]